MIRLMAEGDIAAACHIVDAVPFNSWNRQSFKDCLIAGNHAIIYEQDKQLLAFLVMSEVAGDAEILNIAVDPKAKRQGIAGQLLGRVIDRYKSLSPEDAIDSIFLEVRRSNIAAIELYRQWDFREVGVRKGYYPGKGGREDALVLKRAIVSD